MAASVTPVLDEDDTGDEMQPLAPDEDSNESDDGMTGSGDLETEDVGVVVILCKKL